VWIAVLGSVKIFPNLEAALKGVFNRVLKFFPNASGNAQEDALEVLAMFSFRFSECEPFPDIRAHSGLRHALRSSCQNSSSTPKASSEPPASPDSRAVTAGSSTGSLRHDLRPRVPAHFLRAYQPAHPVKLSWHASTHSSVGVGCLSALPSRCMLRSVTHCGPTL
jgi:hypothetical protein